MNNIMTHVVTEGTGRAAQIPGLVISGKTGTTNNSTNAWFNAFTGNLVGSVWFGNDDNSPMTGSMPGGALPAQTWREIMAYAHQGLETKPPFGVPRRRRAPQIAAAPVGEGRRRHRRGAAADRPVAAARRASSSRSATTRARPGSTRGARRAERYASDADGGVADRPRRRDFALSGALDFAGRARDFRAAARSAFAAEAGAGLPA